MSAKKTGRKSTKKTVSRTSKRSPRKRVAKSSKAPKRGGASGSGYGSSWRAASDDSRTDGQRIAAIARLGDAVCDDAAVFKGMLGVLRDRDTSLAVRLAALAALQAASFSASKFDSCRPAYMSALRAAAKDPEPEMRQRALGLLAREKDGHAQKLLLDGLEDPAKALVPPEKALQLLSYDAKAEAYPAARRIVQQSPNTDARREALRLLAADATSTKVFERILLDKNEQPDVRQISASALQALAPEMLQKHARDIVLDATESQELQATSLTALTQFGKQEDIARDDSLTKRADALQRAAGPESVKQSAKQFISKYKP